MRTASMTAVLSGLAASAATLAGETVDFTMRTVALIGDAAPGADGAYFVDFVSPVMNAAGDVCFRATLSGPNVNESNDEGIWALRDGVLSLIVREGDAAPGFDGAVFGSIGFLPAFGDASRAAFFATIETTDGVSTVSRGVWKGDGKSLDAVALAGDVAPGVSGAQFTSLSTPSMNNAGQIVFRATVSGDGVNSSNSLGIWSEGSGDLQLLARHGDIAPGTDLAFSNFFIIPALGSQIDRDGRTVVWTQLVDPVTGQGVADSVFAGAPGNLEVVLEDGIAVPGMDGAFFTSFSHPRMGDEGRIAFEGSISTGSGFTGSISTLNQGEISNVVVNGDPIREAPGFNFFGGGLLGLNTNGGGRIAFWTSSSMQPAYVGGWSNITGELRSMHIDGQPAPGTDANFTGMHGFLPNTMMNDRGQLIFWTQLSGVGVNNTNNFAMWLQQPDASRSLIIRKGFPLDVSDVFGPGDIRTVEVFDGERGTSHDNGKACSFNDRSELSLMIRFSDGSGGVFVLQLPRPCLYDLNTDGVVNGADLQNLLTNWGASSAAVVGPIGGVELSELLATWGPCED